jgi:sarcosine oxidase, subunit gamma
MPELPYRLLPPATRLILHGDDGVRAAAAAVWSDEITRQTCRARVGDSRASLWLGPDETLLIATADGGSLLDSLEGALGALPHALVDVSHRQLALEIRGPHAATLLSSGCPLDLDLDAFPVGMCTRTIMAKADIVLWRTEAAAFHLEIWRSFQSYACGMLCEYAREFGPGAFSGG